MQGPDSAGLLGATVQGSAEIVGVSLRGSADSVSLVDLLSLIEGNGHAGTLKLFLGGERSTKLHFFKGKIYLPLAGSRGAYRLGALLVRSGKLKGRDLLRALQVQKSEGHRERLGDLLVRLKLVSREDLDKVIRAQFEEEICDLLFEDGAYFEFKKDVLPAGFADRDGNIQALGFDIRSILMEASRRQDEWNQIHRIIPSARTIFTTAPLPSGSWDATGSAISQLQLPPGEADGRILARWREVDALFEQSPFDGTRTVEEIVGASGVSAFVAMGVIADLRQQGLLRPLTPGEVEASALELVRRGQLRQAYDLYEWANEADGLRATAANLDKVLLRTEFLKSMTFSTRSSSERAVQILSRLLRRGAPFHYLAREGDSLVEVYYTPGSLRLHLLGPRRTHSTTRYLRRRRAISSKDLERARKLAKQQGRNLDRLLVEDGFVDKEQWVRAVKDKAVSGLFSVFGWAEPHIEVTGGAPAAPRPDDVQGGLVIEIPLTEELRGSVRRDLLRWKVLLKEIPTPDVMFTCVKPSAPGQPRRAHDLFDGRRSVGELIRLARVAPLELVRFVYDCIRGKRIRRLTDREHYEQLEAARQQERLDDAIAYCKSAKSFGYAPQLYSQRLDELRQALQLRGPRQESQSALEGELDSFSLAELLQLLHQGRRVGTLKVGDGEQTRTFYLYGGDLHVIKADDRESDQEVWDLLMGDETRMSLNLGKLLGGRSGAVDESEIDKVELERLKQEILDTFFWQGARFEFIQNLLPTAIRQEAKDVTKVSLRIEGLLFQAMAMVSEMDDLRRELEPQGVYRYTSPPAQLRAIQGDLGATGYLFDGKHTLEDVVRISGEARMRIFRAARDLLRSKSLVLASVRQRAVAASQRRALASGRIPRLHVSDTVSEHAERRRKDGRVPSTSDAPVLQTEDQLDFADLGDSFAEEGLDDPFGDD